MVPRQVYEAQPRIREEVHETLKHLDSVTRQLLFARGITTRDDAEKFLHPNYDTDLHDPFLFTDMEKAVGRILHAIHELERPREPVRATWVFVAGAVFWEVNWLQKKMPYVQCWLNNIPMSMWITSTKD